MNRSFSKSKPQAGFTLLEVIMSLGILLTMSIAATSLIRNSIDLRYEISTQSKIVHGNLVAMQKLTNDLEHLFFLHTKRTEFNFVGRATKSLFRVKQEGDSYELRLTTYTHRPLRRNSHESDLTYVVYRVVEDKDKQGLSHLYRGEAPFIPANFDEEIPMQIVARNVKTFKIWPWDGRDWEKNGWDSERSDWRDKVPKMIFVEIETWEQDTEDEAQELEDNTPTSKISTVVYLPTSLGFQEKREGNKEIRWW
jgi:prepilin-type N-terminal cleavage/methylation domain-containing protein